MKSEYEIERHRHGWLLCAAPGERGIPMGALGECSDMFPKRSVINAGIAHHFNVGGYSKHVIMAIVTPEASSAWEKEIAEELKDRDPQVRWWLGTDVGKSSAALFHVFCREGLKWETNDYGEKATPADSSDFGRCKRLLDSIPEWRNRLPEVAAKYPETAWPAIVARWPELEASAPGRATEILRECHNEKAEP